jgi:ribosomal protein S18 acetylase RimI-like enzyme
MSIEIRQIKVSDAASYRECLDSVARERRYLAQVEALPLDRIKEFVANTVATDAAQYVAVEDGRVVGWCDAFGHWAYALQHVGSLGMGVHRNYRHQGLGTKLIKATLEHAMHKGIYRVTLEARSDNINAIRLYERIGFRHEALVKAAL